MKQDSFNIISSAITDRGLSQKRPQNEDSYLEMPTSGLFVVADGVGGAQAGEVASQMAIEILSEAFFNRNEKIDTEDLLKSAILKANGAIFQTAQDLPQLSKMATTIVALHISENIATIGHAGDSRLYRMDSNGNLFRETQDHSLVEEEVRAGRLSAEEAENHPNKNIISRALGVEKDVEVDMKTIMFAPNTTFLLCSDGVTRHISDHEIAALFRSRETPRNLCHQIKNICYSRGAEDNLTAVIVKVGAESEYVEDFEENTISVIQPSISASEILKEEELLEIPTQDLKKTRVNPKVDKVNSGQNPVSSAVKEKENNTILNNPTISQKSRDLKLTDELISDSTHHSSQKLNLLTNLLSLIAGMAIGAGALYLWIASQPKSEIPTITKYESPDIAYSAFEDNRRNVDKDPLQYILSGATTAEDAEDYYLLGRAYTLTGKYEDAKIAFLKAKERLPMSNEKDKEMLKNEIQIGLALTSTPENFRAFENERNQTNNSTANSNISAQTNQSTTANSSNLNINRVVNQSLDLSPTR